jgi:hypothetical protein
LLALRGWSPKDEELAEDYEKYLAEELGTLSCALEGTGEARKITQTINVPPNATYDGHGERLTADAAAINCDASAGEQAESQRPIFCWRQAHNGGTALELKIDWHRRSALSRRLVSVRAMVWSRGSTASRAGRTEHT